MKVGVFGGAFDPPHFGHLLVIDELLKTGGVDEVWLVPTGDRQDKEASASALDRVEMLSRMLREHYASDGRVKLSRVQVEGKLPGSTTWDLLEHFQSIYPQDVFYFVIGQDLLSQVPRWKQARDLVKKYFFLVIPRANRDGEPIPQEMLSCSRMLTLSSPASAVSSSEARAKLSSQEVGDLIPQEVLRYIYEKGLYAVSRNRSA